MDSSAVHAGCEHIPLPQQVLRSKLCLGKDGIDNVAGFSLTEVHLASMSISPGCRRYDGVRLGQGLANGPNTTARS